MKTYAKLLCIAGLLAVVAFRPWHQLNKAVGLRSVADSVELAMKLSDSVLVHQAIVPGETPVQVVLPTEQIDELVNNVQKQESTRQSLTEKKKRLDSEIKQLRKSVDLKQETIVSLREIDELLSRQNRKKTSTEEESDLEKSLNVRESKNKQDP